MRQESSSKWSVGTYSVIGDKDITFSLQGQYMFKQTGNENNYNPQPGDIVLIYH